MRPASFENPPPTARSAFTLIELLVVIAIISLLIGILLPALGKARGSAVELACRVRVRELSTANFLYATDNRDRTMPTKPIPFGRDSFGFATITKNWAYTFDRTTRIDEGFLIEYVDNAVEIVGCPLNQRQDPQGIAENPNHGTGGEGFNSQDIFLIDRRGEQIPLYNPNRAYGAINELKR